jgi:hypothetical protein
MDVEAGNFKTAVAELAGLFGGGSSDGEGETVPLKAVSRTSPVEKRDVSGRKIISLPAASYGKDKKARI